MTKKKGPKVLVGITTYEAKDYMFDHCINAVRNFDYDNFDYVVVDNTKTINYFLKLKRRGHKNLYRVERGASSREALTKSQNKIRQLFLEGDYDYLLMVESDLLPPKDTIERLLGYGKSVVGSLYFIGDEAYKIPCIFLDDVTVGGFTGTRGVGIIRKENKQYRNPAEIDEWVYQGLKKCHGCGFGSTLIRRDVVEKYVFWTDERMDNKHSDVYFYLDLSRDNIPVYVDTSVIVPHFPTKWSDVKDR